MFRYLVTCIISYLLPIAMGIVGNLYTEEIETVLLFILIGMFLQCMLCYINLFCMRIRNNRNVIIQILSYLGLMPFLLFLFFFCLSL